MDNPGSLFMKDILDEMKRQGINKTELANRLGVTKPSITHFFYSKNLTLGTMTKIAEAIGCTYKIELITPNQMETTNGK